MHKSQVINRSEVMNFWRLIIYMYRREQGAGSREGEAGGKGDAGGRVGGGGRVMI